MSKIFKKIVITGAAGWLGRGIVDYYYRANNIRTIEAAGVSNPTFIRILVKDQSEFDLMKGICPDLDIQIGDVRNSVDTDRLLDGMNDALVIHTAGVIHPIKHRDLMEVNFFGTKNILDSAIKYSVAKIVVMSSNSPLGCNPAVGHLFDEYSNYNPYMGYGNSKMRMELLVKKYTELYDIDTVIIRAPWFYGRFQPPRQTLFFSMIKDGKVPIVGNGNNLRSMAYIDNLSQGIALAASSQVSKNNIYWIADKEPYSMNAIIDTVEDVLENDFSIKCARKRIRLPSVVSEIAQFGDFCLQKAGFYNQKIHVLSEMNKNIACDISKAQRELGYDPKVSLRDGMHKSVSWIIEQGYKI